MMIPTHVTSFAADASVQNSTGQEAGNATSGDSQTTQSENNAATQNDSSATGADTNAGSSGNTGSDTQNSTASDSKSSTSSDTQNSTGSDSQSNTTNNAASDSQSSTTTNSDSTNTSTSGTTDNITGGVTVEDDKKSTENVTGDVIVDENNDNVEIKKDDKPYLALGADLSDDQKNTVLSLMGIDPANLANYNVTYVTNAQEHQYLDSYVDSSKIGSKSWSSVVIVKRKKGNGLNISTNNITYCTVGMYKNALTTAGITDADIIVAGPKPISGTAALVGIFEAYEAMTGEAVQDNVVDAALNELVVTGELEASIQGLTDQEVEEFIAYIKSLIAEKGLTDEKSINEAIDEACDKYGVTLSDDERQKIVDLLLKITSLGIDLSGLVDYAASLYNSFKNGGSSSGIIASIGNFFGNIFSAIGEFFKNLFK
jgi:Predicted secreted protein